jgi:uncharacterized repeat protein (TIGR04002 family)
MNTRYITISAVLAALIFIAITLLAVPNGMGGFIHFGDALIFAAAVLLPRPYAMAVAAIGPGLFNLVRGPQWLIFTIIIKPLMTLCFRRDADMLASLRNKIAPYIAGAINTVLYFFANIILAGDFAAGVAALPCLLFQAVGSIIAFYALAALLTKSGLSERIYSK